MQSLSGFARKYAIMEELDSGFGAGHTPEAFVRLDSWEGRIQASLHVKGLKQGPYTYKLYLIFAKHDQLIPLSAGSLSSSYNGMQNGLEIDAETLKKHGLKPENIRFAAITAENQDKKWVPLFSSFEKSYKWDESIRQVMLRRSSAADRPEPRAYEEAKAPSVTERPVNEARRPLSPMELNTPQPQPMLITPQPVNIPQPMSAPVQPVNTPPQPVAAQAQPALAQEKPDMVHSQPAVIHPQPANANTQPVMTQAQPTGVQTEPAAQTFNADSGTYNTAPYANTQAQTPSPVQANPVHQRTPQDLLYHRCDMGRLEESLKNYFEECTPFKRASRGYSWYRVSDLAKLSNIMYMSGVNVPVFANPKILVGLFKYKHILAGLYHGDNGAHYYVIGVPAKNETDNRPFETACRWVPVSDSPVRDMGGYWLVYVSLKSGEIVV